MRWRSDAEKISEPRMLAVGEMPDYEKLHVGEFDRPTYLTRAASTDSAKPG